MTESEKVEELAAALGATPQDLVAFCACLSVWTAKGYSLEDALAKNLEAWHRLLVTVEGMSGDARAEMVRQMFMD